MMEETTMDAQKILEKYSHPVKYPAVVIKDRRSGRTLKLVDLGSDTIRPYITARHWAKNGKSMIIAEFENGIIYEYDVQNETLKALDTADISNIKGGSGYCHVTPMDEMFYIKSQSQIWKMDLNTYEKKMVSEFDPNHEIGTIFVTNDGKYLTCYWKEQKCDDDFVYGENIMRVMARLDCETGEWDTTSLIKKFDTLKHPHMGHPLINPEYHNIAMFCHEGTTQYIPDRIWRGDVTTGESHPLFIQAPVRGNDVITGETTGHEIWGMNGENVYFVKYPKSIYMDNVGKWGVVRIDKDGEKREYLNADFDYWHCCPSFDDKWVVADTIEHGPHNKIVVISTLTYTSHVIADFSNPRSGNHPFHPHPQFSPDGKYVSWQMSNPEKDYRLTCAYTDISDLTANEISGGRIKMNDDITFVSYNDSEWCACYVEQTEKDGVKCCRIPRHASMYADVADSVATSKDTSLKVKITYFDDRIGGGLLVYYTSGIKDIYDVANQENKCIVLNYTGTNTWKTEEISIDSINMSGACKYLTDLRIQGLDEDAFVKSVEIIK